MSETAIKVENLYKEYKLGVISHGTLYRDMQSWWAKVRGKEDPNSLISSRHGQAAEKDSFLALNGISFEVKEGDRLGIIGKNGAGKSTLLKILSQITSPSKGNITIRGKVGSLLEVGTGFHSELTGRENIYLNGSILGMNRHEISRKLDEIVDFAGIEKHLDTPVKRYSSGMMVRLGFAVAAHLDTDILIADEVLAVGDAEFQKKALDKMGDLSTGEGRTVLFVSHNMAAVKRLCNCGITMEKGKIRTSSNDVEYLITDYHSDFQKRDSSLIWKNDGNLNNPYFTPICIELQEEDGSVIINSISAEKNYRIKLVFNVEEINSQLDYFFSFSDINGIVLFFTRPFDYLSTCVVKKGINTVYCTIPKNLLNIHSYIIALGADIKQSEWIINPDSGSCLVAFKVTKKGDMPVTPNSIISPQIKWLINNF
jgi:lipopolysaccharide transport system ATP-binding protein